MSSFGGLKNGAEHGSLSGSSGASTASLIPESSVSVSSGSVSPTSTTSTTPFPGEVAALLQQLKQTPVASQSVSLNDTLAQNKALLDKALKEELARAAAIKEQLAVLDSLVIAQAVGDRQRAALLAANCVNLPSALQQAAAINALLLSSSLATQALTPVRGLTPAQLGALAGVQALAPLQAASLALAPQLNPLASLLCQGITMQQTQASDKKVIAPSSKVAYRDLSLIPDPVDTGKGRIEPFPAKLHRMLSELEQQEGGTDIASFLAHGRAFAIHKPKKFAEEVMPKYFRMSRFSSFQRQLNLYDFQRITEGKDKGAYWHELFLYERPGLTRQMKRTKIKGNVPWSGQQQDVDFYKMPPVKRPTTRQDQSGPLSNGCIAIAG
jgi:hypothetical protein